MIVHLKGGGVFYCQPTPKKITDFAFWVIWGGGCYPVDIYWKYSYDKIFPPQIAINGINWTNSAYKVVLYIHSNVHHLYKDLTIHSRQIGDISNARTINQLCS